MKIVICGSMAFSKKMLELENKLKDLGHEVVLPLFTKQYSLMSSVLEMEAAASKNKLEEDLIRGYFEEIKKSDAVLVIN